MRSGVLVLAVLTCVGQGAGAYADDVVVESRRVEGSSVQEVSVTAHSPLPPAAIMRTVWRAEEYADFMPYLKRLDVLRDDGDTRVVYEQIRIPVLKNRDVTLRMTRTFSPATGYEITTEAVPEGPPEGGEYVRVRMVQSLWRLVPTGEGTTVTYTVLSDPGGWLPSWVVNRGQQQVTSMVVRTMLERARATNG